jgi:hypothetical protein
MPDLLHHAYSVIEDSLNHDNILELVEWLSEGNGDKAGTWSDDAAGRYGEWSARLKRDACVTSNFLF